MIQKELDKSVDHAPGFGERTKDKFKTISASELRSGRIIDHVGNIDDYVGATNPFYVERALKDLDTNKIVVQGISQQGDITLQEFDLNDEVNVKISLKDTLKKL